MRSASSLPALQHMLSHSSFPESSLAKQGLCSPSVPCQRGSGLHARFLPYLLCAQGVTVSGAVPCSRGPPQGERWCQSLCEALTGLLGCCHCLPKEVRLKLCPLFWGHHLSSAHSLNGEG